MEKVNNNRTCEEVGIPPFWCSCLPFYEVTAATEEFQRFLLYLAEETVVQINEEVHTPKIEGHDLICEKLTLWNVTRVWVLSTFEDYYKFQFTITESPSVTFEAVVLVTNLKYRPRKSTDSFPMIPVRSSEKVMQRIMYVRRTDAYAGLCETVAKAKKLRPDLCVCKSVVEMKQDPAITKILSQ